jgi:hypothetical protein
VRKLGLSIVLALTLAASCFGFAVGNGFGSEAATPSLRLVDRHPLTVKGLGFKSGERVKVVLNAGGAMSRRATANAAGSFVVSFGAVSIGRCDGFSVQAFGSRGSRTALKLPQPACLTLVSTD